MVGSGVGVGAGVLVGCGLAVGAGAFVAVAFVAVGAGVFVGAGSVGSDCITAWVGAVGGGDVGTTSSAGSAALPHATRAVMASKRANVVRIENAVRL